MLHTLAPELLARILRLALGPEPRPIDCTREGEREIIEGKIPIVLGCDPRGLSRLRLVCKAFREALRAIPVHLAVSTSAHIDSLATLWRNWDVAAITLKLSDDSTARDQVDAASALPDRQRKEIVAAEIQELSQANISYMLRQLPGLNHVAIFGLDRPRSATVNLDCLSHIQRLDLHSVSIGDSELLVPLPLALACSLHCALP